MHTYQHTAFIVLDGDDILDDGQKIYAGVGFERRLSFLD
jgi:hypothetical protein